VRKIIRFGLRELEIFPRRDYHAGDQRLRFSNKSAAFEFLQSCVDDPRNESILRNCLAEAQFSPNFYRTNWKGVLQQLAHQLAAGNVIVVTTTERSEKRRGGGAPVKKKPKPKESPEAPVAPAKPKEEPKPAKWVEFMVIDEDTGDGKPEDERTRTDVTLRIKIPTRAAQDFGTNQGGVVRIEQIVEGDNCNIEEIVASEHLEVIEIS
jgi:hypothetical protein